jgi:hypothetical protein
MIPRNTAYSFLPQFLIFLLFIGFVFISLRPIIQHDVWWHLASGRYIVSHHHLPLKDVFSFTCKGHPWVNGYWLFEVGLYMLYAFLGLRSLLVYKALMILLVFIPVYQRLRLKQVGDTGLLLGTWLAFWGGRLSQSGWSERADLITLTGVSALLLHFDAIRARRMSNKTLWIWPVFFLFWTNMHPGYLVGLTLIGLFLVEYAWKNKRFPSNLVFLVGLCAIATLATPYGMDSYRIHKAGISHSMPISEWNRPLWAHFQFYWLIFFAYWGTLVESLRQRSGESMNSIFVALLLSAASLRYVLFVPFFVIFAIPDLIERLQTLCGRSYFAHFEERYRIGKVALSTLLVTLFAVNAAQGISGGIAPGIFPVQACQFIDQQALRGPFFNAYSFGGYWIWHFGERRPVFIDGRYPTVQGYVPLWESIKRAQEGSPSDWQAFLNRWQIQTVLMDKPYYSKPDSIYPRYFPVSEWSLIYRDSTAIIYQRHRAKVKSSASAKAVRGHAR